MAKAEKKFYGVRRGFTTGVFSDYGQCRRAVSGYPDNEFKGFPTEEEAREYLATPSATPMPSRERVERARRSRLRRPRIDALAYRQIREIVQQISTMVESDTMTVVRQDSGFAFEITNEPEQAPYDDLMHGDALFEDLLGFAPRSPGSTSPSQFPATRPIVISTSPARCASGASGSWRSVSVGSEGQ
ncbi:Ribonuclease H1 [Fusarium austroafricanum]|uniref:Ribonuclease H1 n=1 Tax=Fusarium austroafricanum TaxID=2364996 RepID=A0A8H4JI37_9HYPO|nr:Ribonuclease H1 [Fusarium austroafricanum]